MSVTNTPSSLQAILRQLDPGTPSQPARPAADTRNADAGRADVAQRTAAAEPRVQVPKDAATFNPNAPRGTYVNLGV